MKMFQYEYTDNAIDDLVVTIDILSKERDEIYSVYSKLNKNPKMKDTDEYKEICDKLVAHNIAIVELEVKLKEKLQKLAE